MLIKTGSKIIKMTGASYNAEKYWETRIMIKLTRKLKTFMCDFSHFQTADNRVGYIKLTHVYNIT